MRKNAISIELKPGKERALANFHPWIFSGALKKMPDNLRLGDEVLVCDHQAKALALGHYCGPQGLVVRIFSFDVDASAPELWPAKFSEAWRLRQLLGFPRSDTTGFRLIHGEGDGLSGLVVDIFGDAMSIKLSNPGLNAIIPSMVEFFKPLLSLTSASIERSYDKSRELLLGTAQKTKFLENGLSFSADPEHGQKTGHFLDQRENRALLKSLAKGKRVLDAFCYSGSFSVYALKGGATSVLSVDISEQAIEQCDAHAEENRPFSGQHQAMAADCFSYLREIKPDEFDIIILDPPAFAKSAEAVMRASRGYKDINLLAIKGLAAGGLLWTFSCSQHISVDLFKKIIFGAAKDAGRSVKIIYELTQGPDHPVSVFCPQSSYLKGLVLQVD
jgi:23S rRNA (cytosine1962-C5)-methyltransferase